MLRHSLVKFLSFLMPLSKVAVISDHISIRNSDNLKDESQNIRPRDNLKFVFSSQKFISPENTI